MRHDDEDSSLLPSPLAQLVSQRTVDRELNDELAAHLEMHTADNLRAGMSPENARRDALLKLGGVEQTKESYRERRSNKGRILCFNPATLRELR